MQSCVLKILHIWFIKYRSWINGWLSIIALTKEKRKEKEKRLRVLIALLAADRPTIALPAPALIRISKSAYLSKLKWFQFLSHIFWTWSLLMKKEKDDKKEVNLNSPQFAFFLARLCATWHQKEDCVVGWWNLFS